MRGSATGVVRAMSDWRAAWQTSPTGFAAVSPLPGRRILIAVGSVSEAWGADVDEQRAGMRSVLEDRALVEGYEPTGLLHRVNAALTAAGTGQIHALALVSRPADGMPPSVAGVGNPMPIIVTPDQLSAPAHGTVAMRPGWAVVMGTPSAERVGSPSVSASVLPFPDVTAALSLLSQTPAPGAPSPARTYLAILVDG